MKKKYFVVFLFLTMLLHHGAASGGELGRDQSLIRIDERLGASVPLDVSFVDENGKVVGLRQLIDRPTLVSFVYYGCDTVCPLLLGGVAEVLGELRAEPGKDYSVLTISFDQMDTPADSLRKREYYLKAVRKPFPERAWRFVIGDKDNIKRFADAVGFKYRREGDIFFHPAALIVLSPKGKIVRYIYGDTFSPPDLQRALEEAAKEKVGPTISKVLLYCLAYDSEGGGEVFNISRAISSASMLLVLGAFMISALRTKIKGKKTSVQKRSAQNC